MLTSLSFFEERHQFLVEVLDDQFRDRAGSPKRGDVCTVIGTFIYQGRTMYVLEEYYDPSEPVFNAYHWSCFARVYDNLTMEDLPGIMLSK